MTSDSSKPKSAIDSKNYTLLIVDDEDDLREVLVFQFQRAGFNVLEANGGREALEIVKSKQIDLIISDVQMPDGNGAELLKNVRELNKEVPIIIFLTGFSTLTLEEAIHKGAVAVFAKPFDQKVLLKTVCDALLEESIRWKRNFSRGEISLNAEITCPGIAQTKIGKISNLSRGGAFITLGEKILEVNDKVAFKIQFEEGPIIALECSGLVKWVKLEVGSDGAPPGCGVEFVDLSDVTKSKLIELINFLKTGQYLPKA